MTGPEDAAVLVVDDSAAKRYLLVSWLSRAGFTVREARTGAEALDRLGDDPVDVVVLDVRLPDMTGFEVCKKIKGHPRYAAVPVIHVSAHAVDVGDRTEGLNQGADGYLVEPIDPEELIASVRAVLRYYRARQRAELLAERLSRLAQTTVELNSAATLIGLLKAAVRGTARIFDGPAAVVVSSGDGERLAGVAEAPDARVHVHPWRDGPDDARAPVGSTVRTVAPGGWPVADWAASVPTQVATARLRADRPAVHVAVTADGPGQRSVLSQLSQAVAAAAEAQRSYDEEHRIAVTLQRSLLPRRLPAAPGIDLAVRYVPAGRQTEVGGDFYELTLIDGRLVVAIGDVAGHSLHAATVMAELRHALRAYAVDGQPPGAVLERLNRLIGLLLPGESATICLLTLDPSTGAVRLANAGHLPPLLLADGRSEFITHRGPLLGARADRPADLEFTLPPGGTLLLYTDGLVERRDADIDAGLATLAAAAATTEADLDGYCGRLLAELSTGQVEDDIAIVAVRRHPGG
ncbi:MAG TPA: fused response regulator/phosphatase [Pilimelia sp.]|nr:fused response regulator/phosphatase [Pilimelia sp.]